MYIYTFMYIYMYIYIFIYIFYNKLCEIPNADWLISMVKTYNGNDVTHIMPGTRFNDFCNDLQKVFLSRLHLPSIVFVIVKNKFTPFFHCMYSYLP